MIAMDTNRIDKAFEAGERQSVWNWPTETTVVTYVKGRSGVCVVAFAGIFERGKVVKELPTRERAIAYHRAMIRNAGYSL